MLGITLVTPSFAPIGQSRCLVCIFLEISLKDYVTLNFNKSKKSILWCLYRNGLVERHLTMLPSTCPFELRPVGSDCAFLRPQKQTPEGLFTDRDWLNNHRDKDMDKWLHHCKTMGCYYSFMPKLQKRFSQIAIKLEYGWVSILHIKQWM